MRTFFTTLTVAAILSASLLAADFKLLNVSYDPTRELYEQFNAAFAKHYKAATGDNVTVNQSHGGSGGQANAVIEGLEADVVTLALAYDIESIAEKSKILPTEWQKRLPNNSTPYTSTVVFLVRKGNPKNIKTWNDLVKPGVSIIAAHPKTSGVARWSYLAGWGAVLKQELGDLKKLNDPQYDKEVAAAQKKARDYTLKVYKQVKVLDSGARGSTQSFVQRGQGDVLLNWENEAYLAVREYGADKYEIVVPPISILAEPPVALIDKVVDKKKTRAVAEAYLKYLYSPEGQEIAARNFYRPRDAKILEKYKNNFAKVELFTIDDVFGGWQKAQKEHFSDGGVFDQINTR
ncbi:MAG: sulfate ABC transporter substrate-binding protein [Planctomycetaceae bacterium]|jgi:sulfate transport system substrate-binding protein|nr:sulfate ABC transporter substrate-binding protein [Planctomycetaceae bacterium]